MEFVELEWRLPFGVSVSEPDEPLLMQRALRGILDEGKPQGAIRWLFFQPNLRRPDVFWFGVLLLSQRARVVFFPASEIPGFTLHHLGVEQPGQGFDVDHLSLEPDWLSWHLTGTDRRHQGGPRTVPLESNGVLWFGMNSAGPEAMPRVRESNVLRFEVPSTDVERRKQLLREITENSVDQILALNFQSFDMPPPWSVQFNFAVGQPGFRMKSSEMARFYVSPDDVPEEGGEIRIQLPAREHRITLSDNVEVLILTFPVPGEPRDRWSLMGWA